MNIMTIEYKTRSPYLPWASYQISKLVGCACARNAVNVFLHHQLQRKSLVSDPGMHHGTCVTLVPWCMSVSLTSGSRENKTLPAFPAHAHQQFYIFDKRPICPQSFPCASHAHSHRAFPLWTGQWLRRSLTAQTITTICVSGSHREVLSFDRAVTSTRNRCY